MMEGLDVCYDLSTWKCDFTKEGYRLPTEAEWEYAARGGNNSSGYKYAGSDDLDAVAWYSSNSAGTSHPAGNKDPNELGLYDMSGNVWEWCWDRYGSEYYSNSSLVDPEGPSSGSRRVRRGGSWNDNDSYLRAAYRFSYNPSSRNYFIGFRPLRTK
ncbi:Formylglycine-generating enzyme [subsurface metagenome]